MKKIFLTCLSLVFTALTSFAQDGGFIGAGTSQNTHPAPNANKTKMVKVMNGDSSLNQSYNRSACGLNYAVDKWKVTKRGAGVGTPPGLGLPATFNFTKLPNTSCFKIDTAFIWWVVSYDSWYDPEYDAFSGTPKSSTTPILHITNNATGDTGSYAGVLIGEDGDKNWAESGTRTFRAEVTKSFILGNGSYNLDITGNRVYETDGFMLMVVYRDPVATYQGTLIINDGCLTMGYESPSLSRCGYPAKDSITGFSACGPSTYADAFLLVSDLQRNVENTFKATLNGDVVTDSSHFFNLTRTTTSVAQGQNISRFGIDSAFNKFGGTDCYTLAVTGLYYQNTCVTCVPSDTSTALSLTKSSSPAMCGKSDGSATVSPVGGARPYKYTWLSPAAGSDSVAKNLPPGTYTVIINDNACKSKVDSVKVNSMGQVQLATPTTTTVSCFGGNNGSATASTITGNSPFQYLWSGGQTTSTAANLSAATYTVKVTDSDGCTDSKTVTINQPNALALTTKADSVLCGKTNGTTTVTVSGGTAPYSYAWTSNGQTTQIATGLAAGTYAIIVTDVNSCSAQNTATVTNAQSTLKLTTVDGSVFCIGTNGTTTANPSGGASPYFYSWNTTPMQTTQTATGLAAGTYTVSVTDFNGCVKQNTATVTTLQSNLVLSSKADSSSCGKANGTATVTITSGGASPFSYSWNTATVQTTAAATGLADGTYTVIVTDANGCSKTTSVTVSPTVSTLKLATASLGSSCGGTGLGGTLSANTISGTAPYTFLWSTSPPQTTSSISFLSAGTYTVLATDAKGCTVQKVDSIPVAVQPTAIFTAVQNISCEGISVQFTNTSTQATGYVWDFGDQTTSILPNPTHTFPSSGTFVITLQAENPPCNDIADTMIAIGSMSSPPINSANVFTPNGDGKNDCFTIAPGDSAYTTAYAISQCLYLEVFDRWGVKVFESIGADNCWYGTNKKDNKPAMSGTYYYVAKLGETTIKGYVTLIR